jgi:carbonic anhydrase
LAVSCSESDPRINPSRYINLSANGNSTSVIKTAGGRTEDAINNIYYLDQSFRIGMIVVVQHTSELGRSNFLKGLLTTEGCAWAPGDSEANIRNDVTALKDSPYVRNEIPVIGYVLDVETGELKEVRCVYPPSIPDNTTSLGNGILTRHQCPEQRPRRGYASRSPQQTRRFRSVLELKCYSFS